MGRDFYRTAVRLVGFGLLDSAVMNSTAIWRWSAGLKKDRILWTSSCPMASKRLEGAPRITPVQRAHPY
jgi:hypothetical protein